MKFEGKEPLYTRVEELYQDTQDIADILLDAEVKLGEMLEKANLAGGSQKRTTGGKFDGAESTLPSGITKK